VSPICGPKYIIFLSHMFKKTICSLMWYCFSVFQSFDVQHVSDSVSLFSEEFLRLIQTHDFRI